MPSAIQRQETVLHEALLTHFRENKVEIANAVTKPFPFLESLRDRALITDKLYDDSQEACRNLVPVGRVVYFILCQIEKTFDPSLLRALFSRVHLKEYPDLIQVHRSFKNVIQDKHFSWESDREEIHEIPSTQPRCEQVPGKSKGLGIKRERESEELPSLLLNGGQGAELSTRESEVQSCAVGPGDVQEAVSSGSPQLSQEGEYAKPAGDGAPEIIVSGESD